MPCFRGNSRLTGRRDLAVELRRSDDRRLYVLLRQAGLVMIRK